MNDVVHAVPAKTVQTDAEFQAELKQFLSGPRPKTH